MSGDIPASFARFVSENISASTEEPRVNNNGTETEPSGDESFDNESMTGNYNTASEVGLEDNISSTGVTIDPGNFSESDIDDDVSSSYAPANPVDAFGGFPESDIEEEDDSMSDIGSASLSFNSDLGSPMHSSCRSYAVSEDREDDREEATPLPFCSSIGADELKRYASSQRRSRDFKTGSGSEKGGGSNELSKLSHPQSSQSFNGKTVTMHAPSARELRTSSAQAKRNILKLQKCQKKRMISKDARKRRGKAKTSSPDATGGGGSSSSSTGLAPVLDSPLPLVPLQVTPPMPTLKPFDADDNVGEKDGSTTRSLCIPILDLCITEDEGYLGMGEDKSEVSENDLTTSQGKPSSKRQ